MKIRKGTVGRLVVFPKTDLAPVVNQYIIKVFGRTFKNRRSLCYYYGIDLAALYRQLHVHRKTLEESVTYLLNKDPIKYKGKIYSSMADLCYTYGVSPPIVSSRLQRGSSLEEALSKTFNLKGDAKEYVYKGVVYLGYRDLFESHGLSVLLAKSSPLVYKGFSYLEMLEIYLEFLSQYKGVRPHMLRTIPFIIYNDTWYATLVDFCKQMNIPVTAINTLIKKMSHLEAFRYCRTATVSRFLDLETGELCKLKDLKSKYGDRLNHKERDGLIKCEKVLRYPDYKFEEPSYWAMPAIDFGVKIK